MRSIPPSRETLQKELDDMQAQETRLVGERDRRNRSLIRVRATIRRLKRQLAERDQEAE
jgi:hypothetical protein